MTLTLEENIKKLTNLYNEKNFTDLVQNSKKILDGDNSSATIWNFLALGYRYLGDINNAVNIYEKLLKLNPENFLLNTNAGNLFFALGRVHDAVKCFKTALNSRPNHIETLNSFGIAHTDLGNLEQAQAIFEKIIELNDSHRVARFRLGRLFLRRGELQEAAKHFEMTDFEFSKTHELECYYLLGNEKTFYEKYNELVKKSPLSPLMAAIICHASIRFGRSNNNPFCSKPMDYILKTKIEETDGLNKDLIENLIKIKTSTDFKKQPLLEKGEQSSGNLFLNQDPSVQKLKKLIELKIKEYREKFSKSSEGFIQEWPENNNLFGWLVSIKAGGQLKPHIHREGWLSGSIYLKMPKKTELSEGNILFGLKGSDYPDEGKVYPEREYDIDEGNIVLFPSSLYHQTLPFKSNEERVSFAFDIIPKR
jgi:tetratricopeptide (TPR) repeat protein